MSDWKVGSRNVVVALELICVVLVASLVGGFGFFLLTVNDKDNTISFLNAEINQLNFTINNLGELTIQAWSDASYIFGSSKWMFLYEPSFGSSFEGNLSFPFPFFSINPSELERLGGKPILITSCSTTGQNEMEGRMLNATIGASYTWNGLEIRVSEANPAYVVLLFKPLS